jgi:hypothetical protein
MIEQIIYIYIKYTENCIVPRLHLVYVSSPFRKSIPNTVLILRKLCRNICLSSGLFPKDFQTKTAYDFLSSFIHATCPLHHRILMNYVGKCSNI